MGLCDQIVTTTVVSYCGLFVVIHSRRLQETPSYSVVYVEYQGVMADEKLMEVGGIEPPTCVVAQGLKWHRDQIVTLFPRHSLPRRFAIARNRQYSSTELRGPEKYLCTARTSQLFHP